MNRVALKTGENGTVMHQCNRMPTCNIIESCSSLQTYYIYWDRRNCALGQIGKHTERFSDLYTYVEKWIDCNMKAIP
jgi:hypothetical protein